MKSYNHARTTRKDGTQPIQVTVRLPGCQESRSASYDTKEECDDFAFKAEREMRVQNPQPQREKLLTQAELDAETVKKALKLFLASKYGTSRQKKHSQAILLNIGNVTRERLTLEWVEDYIELMRSSKSTRRTPYAFETIKGQLNIINRALRWRAQQQRLVHIPLPFRLAEMFPKNWQNKRKRRFEPGEEAALVTRLSEIRILSSRPFWLLLVQLALSTGARLQELLDAKWSMVTWERKQWLIEKSKTGERYVPLSKESIRVFRELETLRHPASDRIFHELGKPGSVSTLFSRYAREAGLEKFTFHCLRHEAISRFVSHKRKMSIELIGLMVGHSSAEMTRHYSHLRGDEVAELLD